MPEYDEPGPWGKVAAALGLLVLVGGGFAALSYGDKAVGPAASADPTHSPVATVTPTSTPTTATPTPSPTTSAPAPQTLRILGLVDVSASMDFLAGDGTRMDLTAAGLHDGLGLLPDSAALGLWVFSETLNGTRDYEDLVPVRTLGTTQRATLRDAIDTLTGRTTHGTGLYDTVLAAYRQMLDDYDAAASNSLLLFTDGANDDPTSISEDDLIRELTRLQDPQRPIQVIAIGITQDADSEALGRIADATGGLALTAEHPEDVATAFQKAMEARP